MLNAIFNPHTPFEVQDETSSDKENPENILVEELKKLEVEAVKYAQNGEFEKSLNILNEVIEKCPKYASGYNNRAQLYRIQGNNESAINDLNKAIEMSHGKGLAASQAYMQRGLMSKQSNDTENALEDFRKASKLGNVFAKQLLLEMNPYAALCNKMLSEVFAKEFNPEVCQ